MPSYRSIQAYLTACQSDESKLLGLTLGDKVVTPGLYIPRAEAQKAPSLTFTGTPSNTYLVIALDIDAPFPSLNILGPILHWKQPGLKLQGNGQSVLNSGDTPFVANYIGPAPPPGSGPHRYVFFLYEQPAGFNPAKYAPPNGKNLSNWLRMRYDLEAFEKEVGLKPAVATNFFTSN
ncbi:hypothetical protein ASPZODRAFT_18186 [Penicilliopsis zonata CBS 506.65]|uniref:Uncharacterized protein n=1 Tax=Penicilliopsis zonata CBS 506.65 TaxID=1073090 RepID=A0A1L9SBN2_9EURO|nr:hypothetical protein ASPZODRAFT_18186 [Penicilliopsis zonata CBS 506.65]OJJ44610.1 hypothetical protein ASPZODRAFT_18186 [Penicilliopsis zonata CBS 506.65]